MTQSHYELSNHLGNVLTTVTGRKLGIGLGMTVEHYEPEVVQVSDYCAFGLEMPGRTYRNPLFSGTNEYRFGFNGKELDKSGEFGSLTHYDYGFRIYNPSIGKFLSVDPLTKSYPMLTPYQFASNRPIDGVDLDGLEYFYFMSNINTNGQKVWKLAKTQDIIKLSTGVGEISMKLSKYGIKADFAYYDADCSWRLVPEYFTQFSLNNITDEQWQSFATIDEIESKVKSISSVGKKVETAVAVASLFDGLINISKGLKGSKNLAGFTSKEKTVVEQAEGIINSKQMNALIKGASKGETTTVSVRGVNITFNADIPAGKGYFGMTNGKDGFDLGIDAFQNVEELTKTVLHELHRLNFSDVVKSGSAHAKVAASSTNDAHNFATKASEIILKK